MDGHAPLSFKDMAGREKEEVPLRSVAVDGQVKVLARIWLL